MTAQEVTRARIERLDVAAYTVPTEEPESDGTLEWDSTTLVLVAAHSGEHFGLGYSYTDAAAAHIVERVLADAVCGLEVTAVPAAWHAMARRTRNLGRPGLCASAIAAVDTALWDLKARMLNVPLADLLGRARESVAVYGSGGFTSYSEAELVRQLRGWVESGITIVKIKIGRDPDADPARIAAAVDAIGPGAELLVDANGAFDRKQALTMAERMRASPVIWFEEPVTSDDLEGLRLVRDRAPAHMEIAAGEYGYTLAYFRRMLEAGAVDVLQADATRCAGYTGFLRVGALAAAHHVPLSAHTAPNLHAHVSVALQNVRHVELFHDHSRVEALLFEGGLSPQGGTLTPDPGRAGNGLAIAAGAARYRVSFTQHGGAN